MDLDTFINLVLLFLFFMGTILIKRVQKKKRKKAAKPVPAPKKKGKTKIRIPFFSRIRDQLQEAVKEMQHQAEQARKQQEEKEKTLWDELAEEGSGPTRPATAKPLETATGTKEDHLFKETYKPEKWEPERAFEQVPQPKAISPARASGRVPGPKIGGAETVQPAPLPVSRPPLQQAVIWAEILGKPVSMKG